MPEKSTIEVSQKTACALKRQLREDLCIPITTVIGFLASVETDMIIQSENYKIQVSYLYDP